MPSITSSDFWLCTVLLIATTPVERPMKVYTFDQMLYTHTGVPDDVVYKVIDTMANNKAELAVVAPALREFAKLRAPFLLYP